MDADNSVAGIMIGKNRVGIVGLDAALEKVRLLGMQDRSELEAALLSLVGESNYIAPSAEDEYKKALFREYRRHLGDQDDNEEEDAGKAVEVLVLGPGCARCEELTQRVYAALAEDGIAADVRHVKGLNEIAEYGLVQTPALVVNGKILNMGTVPSKDEIKTMLRSAS